MLTSLLIVVAVAGTGAGLWTLAIIGSSASDALDPDLPHVGWRDLPHHIPVRLRRARMGILVLVPLGSVLGFACASLVLLGTSMDSQIALHTAAFIGAPLGTLVAPVVCFRWLLGQSVSHIVRVAGTAAAVQLPEGFWGGRPGKYPVPRWQRC